jgi:uncharacterized protein
VSGGAARARGLDASVIDERSNGLLERQGSPGLELLEFARRLQSLPRAEVLGGAFPIAEPRLARLLGLAFLDRASAGPGLLLPRCRSVHTIGMRFRLDVYFLGRNGEALAVRRGVRPWRLVRHRDADSVLEVPAAQT